MEISGSVPCVCLVGRRGSKMVEISRKSRARKFGRGRGNRGVERVKMGGKIEGRIAPGKEAGGSKQVSSPVLLRRSPVRYRWHLQEKRRSARVVPESAMHFGYWRTPSLDERENAAVVIQAQWRMCVARDQYRSVQDAALSIQRHWREFRRPSSRTNSASDLAGVETSFAGAVMSNICGETNGYVELVGSTSADELLWEEMDGTDCQRSWNMHGLSVGCVEDSNVSAIQEEEIFDTFLSFLPCAEHNFIADDLYCLSGTGAENREFFVDAGFPNLPEFSIAGWEETDIVSLQSPLPTTPWNYDSFNLDSPACSPSKELTFARISIDGSLPPTPIKEWSSRKREYVKSSPAVPIVWNSGDLDMVEPHHSPIKEWASPLTRGRKSAILLLGSPTAETNRERFQLPTEWFTDLDELDAPESGWDTSEVTSISFSPPLDHSLEPSCGFTEVSSPGRETMMSSSLALVYIPEESICEDSPLHRGKKCALITNSDVVTSPISVKRTARSSPKTIDLSRWRDTTFPEEDIDDFSLTPSAAAHVPTGAADLSLNSPLSPALEEELLDELTKLFQGSSYPEVGPSLNFSSYLPGHRRPASDVRCSNPLRTSHPKALSKVCGGALGNDGFLVHSARKLDFNFEAVDGPVHRGGNQEGCRRSEEHQGPTDKVETRKEAHKRSLPPQSNLLPNFTRVEPAIFSSQGPNEIPDGNGQSLLEIYEELDDGRASRVSSSYGKRCQSTVTDFLLLVEKNFDTGADGSEGPPRRGSDISTSKSPSTLLCPGTQLLTFEGEDDFCDKAVDGNVIVVKDATYQGRNVLPDSFHSPSAWKEASAMESPSRNIGIPVECASVDRYEAISRSSPTFSTPKVQISTNAGSRSCGAIYKLKPPLPEMSRRTSFDQFTDESGDSCTRLDERKSEKVSERLLFTSPASPDSPFVSAALSSVERSSALCVSKKYFLQSPSSRMRPEKCDCDTDTVASQKSIETTKLENPSEEPEEKASAKHARVLFSCQESSVPKRSEDGALNSASLTEWNDIPQYSCFEDNYEAMLKMRGHHRLWFPENLSSPLLLTNGAESTDCSFRKTSSSAWDCGFMTLMTDGGLVNVENSSPSLHDLCKLWDEECIDLVTRSLKYKSLMTDPNLLRHEVKMALEKSEPTSPQSAAWEIQNIERLQQKLENREALKELIQQQRDTIYINIATNASMRERYRLYSKWGIRRMSRGRLRKVIYELLWKDPKRFHASADLVLQYL